MGCKGNMGIGFDTGVRLHLAHETHSGTQVCFCIQFRNPVRPFVRDYDLFRRELLPEWITLIRSWRPCTHSELGVLCCGRRRNCEFHCLYEKKQAPNFLN